MLFPLAFTPRIEQLIVVLAVGLLGLALWGLYRTTPGGAVAVTGTALVPALLATPGGSKLFRLCLRVEGGCEPHRQLRRSLAHPEGACAEPQWHQRVSQAIVDLIGVLRELKDSDT